MPVSRREFIAAGASAAGLWLGVRVPELAAAAPIATFDPNVFVSIAPNDVVTVWVIRLEMGQGVRTLLPMIIAEELGADLARVHVEQASPGGRFRTVRLHTSGSSSSSDTYRQLRIAGAAAREMLVAAAAAHWKVDAATCRVELGAVIHGPTNRRRTFGQLATAAATLPVPRTPTLKDPATFTVLGRPTRRTDGRKIVTGRAQYGLDVKWRGMLYASIVRSPTLGATLKGFDAKAALRVPGVRHVIAVNSGVHHGVAVLASDTWTAMKGRARLHVEWEPGAGAGFDSAEFLRGMPQRWDGKLYPIRDEGDATAELARSATRLEATYEFPFQAHAPLETMNCTAHVRETDAEVWVPTQSDVRTLKQAALASGLPEDRIRAHHALMGGGFGRRLFADYVAEAVQLSAKLKVPVQVLWTREDDMRNGYFQPATMERFRAGIDAGGRLQALAHQTTTSELTIYDLHDGRNIWTAPPKPPRADNAIASGGSPWGAFDNPYTVPHLRVDCADATSPVPVGPWRAVEYPSTVFGRESFLDEIAVATGKDPIALRLELLPRDVKLVGTQRIDRARLAASLEAVRERAGWGTPFARERDGRLWGRGVACSVYHTGSYIAMVAELSVARDLSDVRVHRIVAAVDCGIPLNPLGVEGQVESGIAWGLSATLLGKVDFVNGAAVQGSFRDFRVLTIDQMPKVETHILPSQAAPRGFGEHPVPMVAPAVANAVFAACGKRVRSLPITAEGMRRA
ncbi:MAG: xanthine dehydrogenase family protein molybdopterin-binding subunit [Gemmatimonadetes bacterium]|nr:xanthine dehydrogenase family protein molybdopterin-binding subunit [Gemmatimonadota bacterium]